MGQDERHYNIETLNKIFAIVALVLLSAVGLLVLNDYARKWKDYQSEFQSLEVEKTRVKLDRELTALKNDPEYQRLTEEITKAREAFAKECSDEKLKSHRESIEQLFSQSEVLKQKFRVTKAEFDAAKFKFEEASAHKGSDAANLKTVYSDLDQKVKEMDLSIQRTDTQLRSHQSIVAECGDDLKELERQERSFESRVNILSRKLKRIDPHEMSFINKIANMVRNLPIIDLANPTLKVQQIVLKDVREDNNFLSLPRVDRCTTCHLGIDNPDYKDAQQPLRTHPNLELYLAKDSAHPIEEFGCTVCHDGRGRGTDFTSAAHTPSTPQQAKEWKEKYGWEKLHHWDKPMLSKPYVEAGCFKCHSGQTTIQGADKLNLGLNIIERAGCYSCHTIEKYKDWPKPGPNLTHVASKTNKEWSYRWIEDPHSIRHSTWMPSYFNQSNNSDPESKARSEQEIHAIVHYLFAESSDFKLPALPFKGDIKKGEELVASVGCFGCHVMDPSGVKPKRTLDQLKLEHGPNLVGFGDKTSKEWLFSWLKDPSRYHPETRMPNLRLTDEEASHIATYLAQHNGAAAKQKQVPAINETILDDITFQFLRKSVTNDEASAKVASMKTEEKLYLSGQRLIAQYGCYSCHDIKGFTGFKPIGTELTHQGSKTIDKLDFGFVHIEHTKEAWYNQKLLDPRIYDTGKIKAPSEKLMMPNYNFTKEEAEAVTTAILGFVKDKPGKEKPRTAENLAIERGDRLVREFNCQGCHIIQNKGGIIGDSIAQWLIKYEEREPADAETVKKTFSPPTLNGLGSKVQTQWLFEFLHQPEIVRPWLAVRMPTYGLDTSELNAFLKYFNALDKEEFPFTEKVNLSLTPYEHDAAEKLFSPEYFDCTKCHIVGGQMPSGAQETWAPNLELAGKRLKPDWVIRWILNPTAIDPQTKMPTFYDPQSFDDSGPEDILDGNEREQIRVLRNYIMSLSAQPKRAASSAALSQPVPATGP